jgi:CHAT domain-containing protein
MNTSDQHQIHAVYVEAHTRCGDWPGLVRYWIAHQHRPALEAAVGIVQQMASRMPQRWKRTAEFLRSVQRDPLRPQTPPSCEIGDPIDLLAHGSLCLLTLYPLAAVCEMTSDPPTEEERILITIGIVNAEKAILVAEELRDFVVAAVYHRVKALGLKKVLQLESAQASLYHALKIHRTLATQCPEVFNPYLATTLNDLGDVQAEMGDYEAARTNCQEALRIRRQLANRRPDVYEFELATTLNSLGNILADLGQLGPARTSFQEALVICHRLAKHFTEIHRHRLAMTLNNLGSIYAELGDTDAAVARFGEALAICRKLAALSPAAHLRNLAMTLHNLGSLQGDLQDLEPACVNLQEALEIRQALAKQCPNAYRPELAMTLHNLGNVQRESNHINAAAANLRGSLSIYRALAKKQPKVYNWYLAGTLNSLGIVLSRLNRLERGHAKLREALEIRRDLARQCPEVYQSDLATALNNLGNIELDLNRLEPAFANLREALEIRRGLAKQRPEKYRPDLATTLNNMGNVQAEAGDHEAARKSYREALGIYRLLAKQHPEFYLAYVAAALNNLGAIARHLDDSARARANLLEALEIRRKLAEQRPNVYRPDLALTLNNLGTVQADLQSLATARASFEEAMEIYGELVTKSPKVFRVNFALTRLNLGTLERELNELPAAKTNLRAAMKVLCADAVLRPKAHLLDRCRGWMNLSKLYLQQSCEGGHANYEAARQSLREAKRCAEEFRSGFGSSAQRKRVQRGMMEVYELLIETCIETWDLGRDPEALYEAVEAAEASRARFLLDLLSDEALQPANTPPALVKRFVDLRKRRQQAEWRSQETETLLNADRRSRFEEFGSKPPRPVGIMAVAREPHLSRSLGPDINLLARQDYLLAEMVRLKREHDRLLANIQKEHDPEFDPDQPFPPVPLQVIQALLPPDESSAFVQYSLTNRFGLALIITRKEVLCVRLRELAHSDALELARAWLKGYFNDSFSAAIQAQKAGRALEAEQFKRNWLKKWEIGFPKVLEPVSELAVRPVVERLAGLDVRHIVLCPNRWLHIFPLHACRLADQRYLSDAFDVAYAPSFSVLHRCASRMRTKRKRLLLVQNPTGNLLFTELEGARLQTRYPESNILNFASARKDRILDEGIESHVLHYSGHTRFDPADPMQSALILGSEHDPTQWLTLREIFCGLNLRQNTLSVINGCESGLLQPDAADEYVNLSTGFLYAGAACVVSALWAVYDLSSALLMDRFHGEWQKGKSVAVALGDAQRWLRDDIKSGSDLVEFVLPPFLEGLTDERLRNECTRLAHLQADRFPDRPPFESPVHWAPFVCTGMGF